VILRDVLSATAVDDRYLAHLRQLEGRGTSEVRLTDAGLVPLIVVDREVALVSTSTGSERSAIRIEEPALVQLVVDHAERVWNAATPLVAPRPRTDVSLSARQRQVLTYLRSGLSDHGIARSLRVSERTVRGDVAGILRVLGARSRWQAGYLAATLDADEAAGRTGSGWCPPQVGQHLSGTVRDDRLDAEAHAQVDVGELVDGPDVQLMTAGVQPLGELGLATEHLDVEPHHLDAPG
jgi:DNA-binding CsgD family transcriptional regulator